jgi:beta-galactosidase
MDNSLRCLSMDLRNASKEIYSGHLKLGGQNPYGDRIGVTNYFLTLNDQPFFGISGEFHFSRYPQPYWEEELLKMKAGGINIVANYIFWNHHEEEMGCFDWSGNCDLRQFVQLCARHGLFVILRIGPFAHGECRNGGLPDWLYGMPFAVRSNDPAYLQLVERYYNEIGLQVRGLMFKDGGPVIGIQLDNEYGHCGAPWEVKGWEREAEWVPAGSDGEDHMRRLKQLAQQAGLDTPLYTITSWQAPILENESLPVYGGYAYPVWIQEPFPSDLYVFRDLHTHPDPQTLVPDSTRYPVLNAEMQGGIQVRANNRPYVVPRSTEALALVRVGGGSNLVGYYVYHGGSQRVGKHGFTHEGLHPQISYDFQAPLGEFGEARESYHGLKLLHLFLQAFGSDLAPMGTFLPAGADQIQPEDTQTPRFCVRGKTDPSTGTFSGYLFLNNFQDHVEMVDREGLRFELQLPGETLSIPETGSLALQKDVSCILPFNMEMGGGRLVSATVQPLTRLEVDGGEAYFFFAPQGMDATYVFADLVLTGSSSAVQVDAQPGGRLCVHVEPGLDSSFQLTGPDGTSLTIYTLTRAEAECAYAGQAWNRKRLVISAQNLVFREGGIELFRKNAVESSLVIFPALANAPCSKDGWVKTQNDPDRTVVYATVPGKSPRLETAACGNGKYLLPFPADFFDGVSDVFLEIDYLGDTAGAYIDGRLVADDFYYGQPWRVGLKRFAPALLAKGLCLVLRPLRKGTVTDVSSVMGGRLQFDGQEYLELKGITAQAEYRLQLF